MGDSNFFGGIIWTNHALERLGQRGLSQNQVLLAFQNPDKTIPGKKRGTTEFHKKIGNSLLTIIASLNDKNEWIVLSCWIDPPLFGSTDWRKKEDYKKFQKASGFRKFFLVLRQQLGF